MSTGIIYNVFDGCELLEASIRSIRNCIDEVVVVYQTTSYYGNALKDYDIRAVMRYLKREGLVDKVICKNSDKVASCSRDAKFMEMAKYQKGLDYLHTKKIDYFKAAAVDEFFIESELQAIMRFQERYDNHRVFCDIKTYSGVNIADVDDTDIIKTVVMYKRLSEEYLIGRGQIASVYIDSVIKYGTNFSDCVVLPGQLVMHHYRLVRDDLKVKVANSSIMNKAFLENQVNRLTGIQYQGEHVDNVFNIDIEGFKNMFYKSSF